MILKAMVALAALIFAFLSVAAGMLHEQRTHERQPERAHQAMGTCLLFMAFTALCLIALVLT